MIQRKSENFFYTTIILIVIFRLEIEKKCRSIFCLNRFVRMCLDTTSFRNSWERPIIYNVRLKEFFSYSAIALTYNFI